MGIGIEDEGLLWMELQGGGGEAGAFEEHGIRGEEQWGASTTREQAAERHGSGCVGSASAPLSLHTHTHALPPSS